MRHQFRRKGKRVLLKGRVGSAEFMAHYAELVAASEGGGASQAEPGTINALIGKYLDHATFKNLAETTRAHRRRILNQFRAFTTPGGRCYGENTLKGIEAKHITAVLEGRPITVQRDWLKALRHLIAFAIDQKHCKVDPTIGIKTGKPAKSDGHLTWGDPQIEKYRERYALGTMARLAIELMLNIAARRNDARLIGRQHLSFNAEKQCWELTWRPTKTKKLLTVRVLPELQAALDAMPRTDAMPFLLTENGRPFKSAAAFGNKFADWATAAALMPVLCDDGKVRSYRAHGLRKAACVQMAEAGCTAMEIMAVSGHKTLAEAQKYVDAADQKRMADAAMDKRAAGSKHAQAVTSAQKNG
jgi:integrase/recombinase XerD